MTMVASSDPASDGGAGAFTTLRRALLESEVRWCLCACTTGVASTCGKQVREDEGRVSAEVFKLEREIREDHLDGLPGGLVSELRVEIGDT